MKFDFYHTVIHSTLLYSKVYCIKNWVNQFIPNIFFKIEIYFILINFHSISVKLLTIIIIIMSFSHNSFISMRWWIHVGVIVIQSLFYYKSLSKNVYTTSMIWHKICEIVPIWLWSRNLRSASSSVNRHKIQKWTSF